MTERSSETINVQNWVLAYIRPMQGSFMMIIKMFCMENITGVNSPMFDVTTSPSTPCCFQQSMYVNSATNVVTLFIFG